MSLDPPKICEFCGENIHGYGHTCSERLRIDEPESEICGRCGEHTTFDRDEETGEWLSVCCGWLALDVDVPAWMEEN